MAKPTHHLPNGRFRNPWPEAAGDDRLRGKIGRVARQWAFGKHPPDPKPGTLPTATPELAIPRVTGGEVRITWVGHCTLLIQLPGLNLLTDPVWSRRPSPLPFAGPKRFVPAIPKLEALPPIDAVLLSHDHYDHLDLATVRALHQRFGTAITWLTPLGYRRWFKRQGVTRVVERDWWQDVDLLAGKYRITAVPARHWTRRRPGGTNSRLWCGWVVEDISQDGWRVNFVGDSAYCSVFGEIGNRLGPFDASMIPIGAYEPRWFMGTNHMNPEEAVRVYRDLGAQGAFIPTHWGTWRLTFEDPLEPPKHTQVAWQAAGLETSDLHLPAHGETVILRR